MITKYDFPLLESPFAKYRGLTCEEILNHLDALTFAQMWLWVRKKLEHLKKPDTFFNTAYLEILTSKYPVLLTEGEKLKMVFQKAHEEFIDIFFKDLPDDKTFWDRCLLLVPDELDKNTHPSFVKTYCYTHKFDVLTYVAKCGLLIFDNNIIDLDRMDGRNNKEVFIP